VPEPSEESFVRSISVLAWLALCIGLPQPPRLPTKIPALRLRAFVDIHRPGTRFALTRSYMSILIQG
jgi:hypothetical protein